MHINIAAVLFALLLGAAPTPYRPTTSATVARLDVTITTTSDWATVDINPARLVAQRPTAVPPDVEVTPWQRGWLVKSPGGVARTVTIRAVVEELTRARTIEVSVAKGRGGKVWVDLRNTSGRPFTAARVVNELPLGGEDTSEPLTTRVRRTRYQFFGRSNPALVRADPNRHVLAFYYPWFSSASYDDPTLADRPIHRWGTVNASEVLGHTRLARSGGIDGFVVSWAGAARNGTAFDSVLRAAELTGGVGTVLLETHVANAALDENQGTDPRVALEWLRQALVRGGSSAFLRSGGVPVVFVYRMDRLPVHAWTWIMNQLAENGLHVRLVGDAPLVSYGAVEWGVYRYAVNTPTQGDLWRWNRDTMFDARLLATSDPTGAHLFAATVSPGYDDRNRRGADRDVMERGADGERYLGTWEAALAAGPDWVLATSWNEWFEGTSVQPSELYGDLALRQTSENAARFVRTGRTSGPSLRPRR